MNPLEIETTIKEYLSQFSQIKTCLVRIKPTYIKIWDINNTSLHISGCYLFGLQCNEETYSNLIFNDITIDTVNEIQSFLKIMRRKHSQYLVDNSKIKGKVFEFSFLYALEEKNDTF